MKPIVIAPKDIQTRKHWWNTFGKSETEISARLLVKFCQHLNPEEWPDTISKAALDKWAKEDFWFNGLDDKDDKFIVVKGDTITLTNKFILTAAAKQLIK